MLAVSKAPKAGGKGKSASFRTSFFRGCRGVGGPEVDDKVLGLRRVSLEIGLVQEAGKLAALIGGLQTPEFLVVDVVERLDRDKDGWIGRRCADN